MDTRKKRALSGEASGHTKSAESPVDAATLRAKAAQARRLAAATTDERVRENLSRYAEELEATVGQAERGAAVRNGG